MTLVLLLACSQESQTTPEPVSQKVETTQAVDKATKNPVANPVSNKAMVEPMKAELKDPIAGKSLAEICSSNGLSLIRWSFKDRQTKQTELCCVEGGLSAEECELDWPSPDVPSCGIYDELRNEIFARYGREFKTEQWKTFFSSQDWYSVDPDFKDTWLNAVAKANIQQLIEMKANKVGCMD